MASAFHRLSLHSLALLLLSFLNFQNLSAQGIIVKDEPYSFELHEAYKPEILHGDNGESYPVYSSGETFINIKEIAKYPEIRKYIDVMYNGFLDQSGVTVEKSMDTLDGLPVVHILRIDKNKEDPFIQHFYYFGFNNKSYEISLSGNQRNRRVMEERFQVSKNSFRWKTKTINHQGVSITAPVLMSKMDIGFYSGCFTKDGIVEIQVMANQLKDETYEKKVKELTKMVKSYDIISTSTDTLTVAGMPATRITATYNQKFKNGKEPRSEYNYVIKHPAGGIFFIWFKDEPGPVDILAIKMDSCIRGMTFL